MPKSSERTFIVQMSKSSERIKRTSAGISQKKAFSKKREHPSLFVGDAKTAELLQTKTHRTA
jgi:hypothetical protein